MRGSIAGFLIFAAATAAYADPIPSGVIHLIAVIVAPTARKFTDRNARISRCPALRRSVLMARKAFRIIRTRPAHARITAASPAILDEFC